MHLQRLFRHTPNITFSFDGDRAGRAAGWKALETTLPLLQDGYQVSFLFLPDGEDPDTMVKKVGKEGFDKLISDATPLPEFLIDTLKQKADINRLDGRAKLAKLAKPMIQQMPKGVMRSLIIDRIAMLTQATAQDIVGQTPSAAPNQRPAARQRSPQRSSATSMTPVRRALSLILQYPQLANEFSILEPVTEVHVRGIKMVHALVDASRDNDQISTASLLERYRQESFFGTLSQLANHQHNNMESLSDDEALGLVQANNAKIIEEFNEVELVNATEELASLSSKQAISELSSEELARKDSLSNFVRESYK